MKEVNKDNQTNKSLIIKKIKIQDKIMNKIINEGFENSENYLKIDPNLIIGKKIKGPRFDQDKNLIPYSIIGDPARFKSFNKRNKSHNLKHFINKALSSTNSLGNCQIKDTKRLYDYVDEEKISEIYENFNNEINKNRKTTNHFMKEVPLIIKKDLQLQEKKLLSKNKSIDLTNEISKYIARKINKNTENLLISRIDEHRIKKEFVENVLNKSANSYDNRIPLNNWMANLRQAQTNDTSRTSYVYYGNVHNPNWVPVKEHKIKNIEIIRNPISKTNFDINKYIRNRKLIDSRLNETSNFTNKINSSSFFDFQGDSKNLNFIDGCNTSNRNQISNQLMVIKGKNLLESEMNITNQLCGRKILYKKDFLINYISGPSHAPEINDNEREKNLSNLIGGLDLMSSYSSNHSKKGELLKINIIK